MLQILPLTVDRIAAVAADICAADQAELDAAGIADTVGMLLQAVPECAWVNEARWDGAPVAIFGVRSVGGMGVPWMLTTNHMGVACGAAVAVAARRAVLCMRADFNRLANLVHRRYARAIRFIEALQFRVIREPAGPGGEFYLFHWEREECVIH